jgi:tetratricopeptide (TPR) repeat protein
VAWGGRLFLDARVDRVAAEEDSFRAALEWSWSEGHVEAALHLVTALWMHWFFGNQTGAKAWLEEIVTRTAHINHPGRLEALCALAALLPAEPTRQQALLREAATLSRRIGDPEAMAAIDYVTGEAALHTGDLARARALLQSGLSGYERVGYGRGIGYCHDVLGWICVGEGDHRQARAHFERAVVLARENHSEWLAAQGLSALAPLSVLCGAVAEGLRLAGEAIAAARRVPIRLVLVMALIRAGETAVLANDVPRVAGFLGEGLRLISELGTQRYLGDCLELVALTQLRRGEHRAAAMMFGAAAAWHQATGGASGVRLLAEQARTGRAELADAMGPDPFDSYVTEGHALSSEQTIDRALASLRPLRATPPE